MTKIQLVTTLIAALIVIGAVVFLTVFQSGNSAPMGGNKGGNVAEGLEPPVPSFPSNNNVEALPQITNAPPAVALEPDQLVQDSVTALSDEDVSEEPVFEMAPEIDEDFAEVPLFFATNRALRGTPTGDSPADQFADINGPLLYGRALVTIPRDHRLGNLEVQSWIGSILFDPNPRKHVILKEMIVEDNHAFIFEDVRAMLADGDDAILLYVHGFNTSLHKATIRAGQLTYDLGWDGPSFLFSWPSQANGLEYLADSTMAERSYNQMSDVLEDLADTGPKRIVVIAHSMGTRVLSHGLARLATRNAAAANKITSVILAAPDIDEQVFMNDLAPQFRALDGPEFTLYASAKDSALSLSKSANGFPRIGDTTGGIPVIDGIDVIDATTTESNFFEHTYFAESTSILTDVYEMVQLGRAVEERDTIAKIEISGIEHWQIKPSGANNDGQND